MVTRQNARLGSGRTDPALSPAFWVMFRRPDRRAHQGLGRGRIDPAIGPAF